MNGGLSISLAALVVLIAAPLGTRLGLWPWTAGLALFATAGVMGALAVLVSVIVESVAGALVGGLVLIFPLRALIALRRAPRTNHFETAVDLPADPQTTFDRALTVARRLRWEVTDANRAAGRIDAIDTTRWFGFKDDITIEVAGSVARTRVTVCSTSRVGRSDLGVNAVRVQRFLAALEGEPM